MRKALAPDISTWPDDEAQLVGSRCGACAAVSFPKQPLCPRCSASEMQEILLPRSGTLVAWTTQGFVPKLPYAGAHTADTFTPFGVGLVQLEDVVRVEGRLTENDPEKLETGMNVKLTFVPFYVDDAGDEVFTFAFAPA